MAKKVFNPFFFFFLGSLSLLLPAFRLFSLLPEKTTPLWWDLKIVILADGKYRLNQKKISYSGNYSFKIIWTGSIEKEKDDKDYILYHKECHLSNWKAEEKKISSELVQTKRENDFKEKPTFHLKYLLRKEKNLHFHFIVEGFPIPQNKSDGKIYLHLPCYSENTELNPDTEYAPFLLKGSNQIFLGEKEIYAAPIKREFCWTWELQKWTLGFSYPTRLFNHHEAILRLSITPHY